MREYCKDITVDDVVRKAYEIQMSTTGPLTNLKFNHDKDKVKQKQAYASIQNGIKQQKKESTKVVSNAKNYEDQFLRIPHYYLEKSDILPEFVDFISIWNHFPSYIQLRKPQKVYATQTDGYNINNLYQSCYKFVEDQDVDC